MILITIPWWLQLIQRHVYLYTKVILFCLMCYHASCLLNLHPPSVPCTVLSCAAILPHLSCVAVFVQYLAGCRMDQPCLVVINHEVMMIVPDYTLTASEWTHSMAQLWDHWLHKLHPLHDTVLKIFYPVWTLNLTKSFSLITLSLADWSYCCLCLPLAFLISCCASLLACFSCKFCLHYWHGAGAGKNPSWLEPINASLPCIKETGSIMWNYHELSSIQTGLGQLTL